jgi:hypothetical protein
VAFQRVVDLLVAAFLGVPIGVLAGSLGARLIRALHLHWSWALLALAPALLVARIFGGAAALGAPLAALVATGRGRRWHHEDLDTGADLAELASRRLTPADVARSRLRHATSPARTPHPPRPGHSLALGYDERRRAVSIPLGDGDAGTHTLVLGATGSGKTVTQTRIALAGIERGMGAIVLDPKGDPYLRAALRGAASSAGKDFREWTPDGGCVYNPYAEGGETEIADKALAGERFTEPHYLRQAQRYLGHVVRALRAAGEEVSMRGVVEHLDPARLEALARGLPAPAADPTFAYLDALSARQRTELSGVRDRLAILVESDVGRWLDPDTPGGEPLTLRGAIKTGSVAYFRLESDTRPLLAQMLGGAIVGDLQTAIAAMQATPVPTLVVIDEFSAVAAEQVVRLFARARSAGFSLLLGTQELADLRLPGRERLLEQIVGNLSALVAHRQVVPRSAAAVAELAGSHGAWRYARHSDGASTRTRVRQGVLDQSRLMRLPRGWAAVIVPGAPARARITRVSPAVVG